VLVGNRPSTLLFLLPVGISALCWPWVSLALRRLRLRFGVS
jgi:cell shape-determining protein MreD